jgi:hypothetical protein
VHRSSCTVPVILVRFWWNLNILYRFLINRISWKSVQLEPSCSMRTEGPWDEQTDMTNLIVSFRNLANAPKNCLCIDGNHWLAMPLCGYCHTCNNVNSLPSFPCNLGSCWRYSTSFKEPAISLKRSGIGGVEPAGNSYQICNSII